MAIDKYNGCLVASITINIKKVKCNYTVNYKRTVTNKLYNPGDYFKLVIHYRNLKATYPAKYRQHNNPLLIVSR